MFGKEDRRRRKKCFSNQESKLRPNHFPTVIFPLHLNLSPRQPAAIANGTK